MVTLSALVSELVRLGYQGMAIARDRSLPMGSAAPPWTRFAAGAGISKQTLYAAYPSKDELSAAMVRDGVDRGFDALRPHTWPGANR